MNKLSAETSPYLLQHQHNPVNWYAWSQEAWQKAKNEDKLVLISIGYSACHWCHVMEREVFEDEECGKFMNQHFVCIKVDREERPDIDSIYMDAIHLMGGRGGWPLNAFALPDGRPVYGGTYFPKEQWLTILENLTSLFKNEPTKILEYADRLHNGLKEISLISNNPVDSSFEIPLLESSILNWSKSWDFEKGGAKKSPKFPMPNNLELLLQYGIQSNNASAVDFVNITLEKMALGGIYDQVGGGFCRYSVDDIWKVPHFEKMLYDNAQLISIYAQAYRQSGNTHYKNVVLDTIDWLEREMLAPSGLFYSALDADSDGVEGKFYVWTLDELKTLLGEDFDFALRLYCLDQHDEWEHGQYILLRSMNDASLAKDMQISESEVASARQRINQLLLNARGSRTRPGLDDKCLTSWNAMMVKAYTEAYNSFGEAKYLKSAEKLAENMWTHLAAPDGVLWHCYTKGRAKIDGFHDDYANLIEAFIFLYESGMNDRYLRLAHDLLKLTITLFYDSEDGLFYFTPSTSEVLITRKKEIQDNVTPASNSVMCKSLFRLGRHLDEKKYVEMSERMLKNVLPQMNYASGYSNWLEVYCWNAMPFHDVVICGENAGNALRELISGYFPGCLFAASTMKSEWPLFHNRFGTNTAIYVCSDNVCHAPVESAKEALLLIK